MDFASNLGLPDKLSRTATDCATTPSSPSSALSRQKCRNSTPNSPLTSSTSSTPASLQRNRSVELSRLFTSGLKRSSSILSISLFRSKTPAGKGTDVNPDTPPKRLKARPQIPARPSERLYLRSLLELGSDNANPTGQKETAEPLVCLSKVTPPRQIDPRPEQQLGDADPDKRGKAFVRIRPDGWLKVVPKQWVEDEFSGDEARTEDSRSVYSQDRGGNWTKTGDGLLRASFCTADSVSKNGPPSVPGFGARDITGRHGSQRLSVAQHRTGSVSHKHQPGPGQFPDYEADELVPAPLCPAAGKNKYTTRSKTKQHIDQAAGFSNKAISRRSSWTSILCDSQSETECSSQHHGRYDTTHAGPWLPSDWHHTVQEELADGIHAGQDKLMADIDEILDLYLTSGHKMHGNKGKMSSNPTVAVKQDLAPDNLRPTAGYDSARMPYDSVGHHHREKENRAIPAAKQHRIPSVPANHQDLDVNTSQSASHWPPRSKQRGTGAKVHRRGNTRLPEEEYTHTRTHTRVPAPAPAHEGVPEARYGRRQDESRNPANALKVAGSPPATATATATVTFFDGNGKTWI